HLISLPQNRNFIERPEAFEIKRFLFDAMIQEVALVGLGGVGKTQISLHIAYWAKENLPDYSVFWVPAYSQASFEQSYATIAKEFNIPLGAEDGDVKTSVQKWLSSENIGPWLIVVDNADDASILFDSPKHQEGLLKYLPRKRTGLTLFTTRSREVALSMANQAWLELHSMSEEEATNLLRKALHRKDLLSDQGLVNKLLQSLTYLPLAVTQAAAYLNRNSHVSVKKYLELLQGTEQHLVSIMSLEFRDSTRYASLENAIARTWMVSFDQIQSTDAAAGRLLCFISRIEPKLIPQSILPCPDANIDINHAIGTLCSYAFLAHGTDAEMFDMHSLVHLATRVWVRQKSLETQSKKEAIQHIDEVFPFNDHENRVIWRQYLPHAIKVLNESGETDGDAKSSLSVLVGRCLGTDGRVKEAVAYFEQSFQQRIDLPIQDSARLASQHELACAYQADGRVKDAIKLLEHVVEVEKTTLDKGHPDRLTSQHELARAYQADWRVKDAIKLLEHVVEVRKTTLNEEHRYRLASQHELACTYQADGRVKDAIKLLEHVVEVEKTTLDKGHPDRLTSQHELARAYQADWRVKDAIKLLEHVVEVRKTTLNEEHRYRLASQHELACTYQADGRVKDAIKLLEHVVEVEKTTLDKGHPDRLTSQHELARAYQADGRVKDAIKLLEHVVEVRKTTLDKGHPDRLTSQHALAMAYQADGRVKDAIKLLEHVVEVRKTTLDKGHPDRLTSQHALAIVYQADGRVKDAITLLEHLVEVEKTILNEEHRYRLASQYELACAYQADWRVKDAIKLLEHVVEVEKTTLDKGHPDRLTSQHALAMAYQADGRVKYAIKLLEHVVEVQETTLDKGHPDRLASQHALAGAYKANMTESEK
ncbi:hypothetical protein BDP81DRAFT_331962, partial [Colletotrichum phormii]